MTAYYNEIDPYAAAWLRNLISAGHIAPGDVDERDIRDIRPDDLAGYTQCHFFAGIGVWSRALRLAGWEDDRPVWTGSCPCQPFSAAGKRGGLDDERHLWPAFFHLIGERRPPVVFGEQVASKDGLAWLDLVQADMEGADYAIGAFDLCAAGVGAPHIRQRLWFVGERLDDAAGARQFTERQGAEGETRHEARLRGPERGCGLGGLADADGGNASAERQQPGGQYGQQQEDGRAGELADAAPIGSPPRSREPGREDGAVEPERPGRSGVVGHPDDAGPQGRGLHAERAGERAAGSSGVAGGVEYAPGEQVGFPGCSRIAGGAYWSDADWIPCRDGKWRPVEPSSFPLAHGAPARVGRLRAYGNAIVAPLAAEFIGAYLDARNVG